MFGAFLPCQQRRERVGSELCAGGRVRSQSPSMFWGLLEGKEGVNRRAGLNFTDGDIAQPRNNRASEPALEERLAGFGWLWLAAHAVSDDGNACARTKLLPKFNPRVEICQGSSRSALVSLQAGSVRQKAPMNNGLRL
jgi:hypothetical protein